MVRGPKRPKGEGEIVDQFMNQVVALAVGIVAMWIVIVGMATMIRGPQAGMIVFLWPIRAGFRLIRRMVGRLLIALGQAIRGGGGQQGGGQRDRRH